MPACSVSPRPAESPSRAPRRRRQRRAGSGPLPASLGAGAHLPPAAAPPPPPAPLLRALMDIKNRTKQDGRWEQNPRPTGPGGCSHSAVKCKNKKGQTSGIPQDASRFFNIAVPPRISLRMVHYIYVSLKYLPVCFFFFFFLNSAGRSESSLRGRYPPRGASWLVSGRGPAPSIGELLLLQLLVPQQPLFHKVSSSVVAALPAAADHPVARDYNWDLQNTAKNTEGSEG